jgi:hypothetical protein
MKCDEILSIQYNAEIVNRFKKEGFPADLVGSIFFVLMALDEKKYQLINLLDDESTSRRMFILYKTLEKKDLLTKSKSENHYELTGKAKDLLLFIRSQFDDEIHIDDVIPESKQTYADDEYIDRYINLFPRSHRSHRINCLNKMDDFFKKFPEYSKELILKATAKYIEEQGKNPEGHKYTRRADYFIWKLDKTVGEKIYTLATWCMIMLDIEKNPEKNFSFMDIL